MPYKKNSIKVTVKIISSALETALLDLLATSDKEEACYEDAQRKHSASSTSSNQE